MMVAFAFACPSIVVTMQTMAIFAMKESIMGIRSYPFPIATKFDTICIAIMGHNHIHLHTYNAITPNLWFELLRVWKQLRGKCKGNKK
jgi:predicted small integral membrane protein